MLKNMSLTFKLALLPAVAIIGLLLFVGFTYKQLSTNDERLVLLESRSYPTLEKADAAIFQFSLLPGLLNNGRGCQRGSRTGPGTHGAGRDRQAATGHVQPDPG